MEFDLSFLNDKGIDTVLGTEYTGSRGKYLSALKRYYSNYEDNRNKLDCFYENGDLENLRIQVHALKSNSEMVGATTLSQEFEAMEKAADEGNTSYIANNIKSLLLHYGEFVELLSPIGTADIEKPADEISAETAKDISSELLTYLDDYDDEKSMELAKKLSGYPFRLRQKEELNKAIKLIADFNYDDAADIIRDITKAIE